jgi:uncharacterized repeat protein (TIGR03843 family)
MVPLPVDAAAVLDRLAHAELRPRGFLANASNHTLLVEVGATGDGFAAVYKPREGERPLWDFPAGTLCCREVAAYEVSAALGWGLVPPTVLRDGPMGTGSVQAFVPHDPARHYFVLVDDPGNHRELTRMATFDLLVNNADRKASHVLDAQGGTVLGIDHGLTFHPEPKLRTVIWDLGAAAIEPAWRRDLQRLADELDGDGPLGRRLGELLAPAEIAALSARARALAHRSELIVLPENRRPYPWPPL